MRKILAIIAAAASFAGLGMSAAVAATASPPDTCNIEQAYCNIIDDSAHPRYIYGDTHNGALVGSTSANQYSAFDQGNGWWWIKNQDNGVQCWNQVSGVIYISSCQNNDPNEEWTWVTVNGYHLIENNADGTHWAVQCCQTDGALDFANGFTDGTEYWNWKS